VSAAANGTTIVGGVAGAASEISWVSGGPLLDGALALRERVFCGEQGVALAEERDGRDHEALHLVVTASGEEVLGTLRVLVEDGCAKIGRVAVDRKRRRQGIASRMLSAALERARAEGCTSARLAAQTDAIELYRKLGFEVQSEPFLEAGIEHVWMRRGLPGEPP
jgi:predicted GNAT family N-acyltransferase